MVGVAGAAFFFGGIWLDAFFGLIAVAAFVEFSGLVFKAISSPLYRAIALAAGAAYLGLAAVTLIAADRMIVFFIVGSVIAVDVFAYFFGRRFGGRKIAPSISPSKTWAGLFGGAIGAGVFLAALNQAYATPICRWYYDFMDSFKPPLPDGVFNFDHRCHFTSAPVDMNFILQTLIIGMGIAVVAQAGDFLESWIKRRAGVKDSSNLIPGHGGVLDRVDGIIAVALALGVGQILVRLTL